MSTGGAGGFDVGDNPAPLSEAPSCARTLAPGIELPNASVLPDVLPPEPQPTASNNAAPESLDHFFRLNTLCIHTLSLTDIYKQALGLTPRTLALVRLSAGTWAELAQRF